MSGKSGTAAENTDSQGPRGKMLPRVVSVLLFAVSFCAVLVTTCQKFTSPNYEPTHGLSKASIDWTRLGLLVAHSEMTTATLVSRNGATLTQIKLPPSAAEISGSPATDLLAYSAIDSSGASHIYTFSLATGAIRQLTHGHAMDTTPKMSEDGTTVFFVRAVTPGMMVAGWVDGDIYSLRVDGAAPRRLTYEKFIKINGLAFFPDQDHILFSSVPGDTTNNDYSERLYQVDLLPVVKCRLAEISSRKLADATLSAATGQLALFRGNVDGGGWYDTYLIDADARKPVDLGKDGIVALTKGLGIHPMYYAIPDKSTGACIIRRTQSDVAWQKVYIEQHGRPFAYTMSADGKVRRLNMTESPPHYLGRTKPAFIRRRAGGAALW